MGSSNDNSDEFDIKQNRLDCPTGWMRLARYETVRFIIDALIESPPNHRFNKSDLATRTGMSREAIRERLPLLVELGVVREINREGWAEYELNNNSRITKELIRLNSAVNAVHSGQSKDITEKVYKTSQSIKYFVEAPNMSGAIVQPYSVQAYSEKSTVADSKKVSFEASITPMGGAN